MFWVNSMKKYTEILTNSANIPIGYKLIDINDCFSAIYKLGVLENLIQTFDSVRIVHKCGVYSLHIDCVLDCYTFADSVALFGKDKVIDFD